MSNKNKEKMLDIVITNVEKHGYYMCCDSEQLKILDSLVDDGLLLRVSDFAPKAFNGFNESYSFVTNDEKGISGFSLKK